MVGILHDSGEQRFFDGIRCITCHKVRNEMIARTGNSSLANGLSKDYIVMKVGYDGLGIKLLKNVTHSLEVVDQRYSLNRAKTSSLVKSPRSRKVAGEILEKTGQRVNDETVRREHHRQA